MECPDPQHSTGLFLGVRPHDQGRVFAHIGTRHVELQPIQRFVAIHVFRHQQLDELFSAVHQPGFRQPGVGDSDDRVVVSGKFFHCKKSGSRFLKEGGPIFPLGGGWGQAALY